LTQEVAVSDGAAARRTEGPRRGRRGARGVRVLVVGIDLLHKQLALTNLSDGTVVRLLGGLVYLDLTRNSGAAFSIGEGFTWLFRWSRSW
jgi:lipoprotein signal peptidase